MYINYSHHQHTFLQEISLIALDFKNEINLTGAKLLQKDKILAKLLNASG